MQRSVIFLQYLSGGRTSSGLLFRLRCFASPRKRLFCPFLLRPEMSPHWRVASLTIGQISQQMSQLDKISQSGKCHNCTVFFQQILCGQRSEGRTMLTEQFSLKCDHQRLFLWRQFLGLVTPEYICFIPISMENTNYRDLSTLNCDIHWISTDVSLGSLFLAKRPKEHLGFACRCTHNLTPLPKKRAEWVWTCGLASPHT